MFTHATRAANSDRRLDDDRCGRRSRENGTPGGEVAVSSGVRHHQRRGYETHARRTHLQKHSTRIPSLRCESHARLIMVAPIYRCWERGRARATRHVIVSTATTQANEQIVVGIDGTPAAVRASVAAAVEADRRGVPLQVVHAWPGSGSALLADVTNIDDLQRAQHERIVTAAVDAIRSDHPALVVRGHLERGSPVDILRRWATDAALLVVGSRGHGPVRRLLLGSVSTGLLDSSACPVMIVTAPARQHRSRSADDGLLFGVPVKQVAAAQRQR